MPHSSSATFRERFPYRVLQQRLRASRKIKPGPPQDVLVVNPVAEAALAVVDPTVVHGSLALTPAVSTGAIATVDPAVVQGSLALTPAVASASATAQVGAVVQASLSVAPTASAASATTVAPTVLGGGLTVAPSAASAAAASVAPTTVQGALSLTPAVSSAAVASVDPTVVVPTGTTVTPAAAAAAASSAGPTVALETPQRVRPAADVLTGGWTVAPLWSKLDEATADDGDFIESPEGPTGETAEVTLASASATGRTTGYYVAYRYGKDTAGASLDLTVALRQGTTTIASWTHTDVPDSWQDARQELTPAQVGAITDHGDLRLRFTAAGTP